MSYSTALNMVENSYAGIRNREDESVEGDKRNLGQSTTFENRTYGFIIFSLYRTSIGKRIPDRHESRYLTHESFLQQQIRILRFQWQYTKNLTAKFDEFILFTNEQIALKDRSAHVPAEWPDRFNALSLQIS
ncbi:hypothetical protein TNCV_1028771 [Trichonephila clavipes]|nr:hypothetical protein TNCV_1028771 [Trichonephila clavipes]